MSDNTNNTLVELAYKLFTRIKDTDFEYIYKGEFSQKISKTLLSLAETNVKKTASKTSIKNRIYFVMVEGLQNITRHQDKETDDNPGMFAIQKNNEKYFITTGNSIKKEDEKTLKPKLEQINTLKKEQLTKIRKEILLSGELSDKGGAGLGMIEMARKTGKKLVFDFEPINKDASFFYFRTEIPGAKSNDIATAPSIKDENSIEDIKEIHQKLEEENILINFNGKFNRDNILSLLSVIKGQMNVTVSSRKVYNIMVEMLQNISKHSGNIIGEKQNRGIFFLSKKDDYFILTSGNYVTDDDKPILISKIDKINSMSKEELHNYFNDVLLDFKKPDAQKTGLGFIDMVLKSGNKLKYNFIKTSGNLIFFTLQATINN